MKHDNLLLFALFGLTAIGIIMVNSAGAVPGFFKFDDPFYFSRRQAIWTVLGWACLLAAYRLDPVIWKKAAPALAAISGVLLILVLIPGIGIMVNGSQRWFRLGALSFQPSEFAKMSIIAYCAVYIARPEDHSVRSLIPLAVAFLSVIVPIQFEPDIGTAALIAIVSLALLYLGKARTGYLIGLGAVLLSCLLFQTLSQEYTLRRIENYFEPGYDPKGFGYQSALSRLCFVSGGLFGVGLGEGFYKYLLPEAHTEFLLAVVGEELGLAGATVVALLFAVFLRQTYLIARSVPDPFQKWLAAGIGLMIGTQTLINLCVVTGLLPVIGIPLPFMSYGGTSIIMNMAAVGVLLRLSDRASKSVFPRICPDRRCADHAT